MAKRKLQFVKQRVKTSGHAYKVALTQGGSKMTRTQQAEMEAWVAQWPVGSVGKFAYGRVKKAVKVVGVTWDRGFPMLELVTTAGTTCYCKYGVRRDLRI